MKNSLMQRVAAALVVLISGLGSTQATAGNLDLMMNGLFPTQQVIYQGYQSVERDNIPVDAAAERKYLIVDFRFQNPLAEDQIQAKVHQACMAMLRDRQLIKELSDSGYDMIAVAFDRHSQYDCL